MAVLNSCDFYEIETICDLENRNNVDQGKIVDILVKQKNSMSCKSGHSVLSYVRKSITMYISMVNGPERGGSWLYYYSWLLNFDVNGIDKVAHIQDICDVNITEDIVTKYDNSKVNRSCNFEGKTLFYIPRILMVDANKITNNDIVGIANRFISASKIQNLVGDVRKVLNNLEKFSRTVFGKEFEIIYMCDIKYAEMYIKILKRCKLSRKTINNYLQTLQFIIRIILDSDKFITADLDNICAPEKPSVSDLRLNLLVNYFVCGKNRSISIMIYDKHGKSTESRLAKRRRVEKRKINGRTLDSQEMDLYMKRMFSMLKSNLENVLDLIEIDIGYKFFQNATRNGLEHDLKHIRELKIWEPNIDRSVVLDIMICHFIMGLTGTSGQRKCETVNAQNGDVLRVEMDEEAYCWFFEGWNKLFRCAEGKAAMFPPEWNWFFDRIIIVKEVCYRKEGGKRVEAKYNFCNEVGNCFGDQSILNGIKRISASIMPGKRVTPSDFRHIVTTISCKKQENETETHFYRRTLHQAYKQNHSRNTMMSTYNDEIMDMEPVEMREIRRVASKLIPDCIIDLENPIVEETKVAFNNTTNELNFLIGNAIYGVKDAIDILGQEEFSHVLKEKYGIGETYDKCNRCKKQFESVLEYKKHMKKCKEKVFCKECKKCYDRKYINRHICKK
eukprot:TRINITY_DN2647_c0_g1_i2.p1 TRINITY_DN2647_c0_g1~~TRINITY_DN2647_c0_g1_i2.p1  ORF type:complete len:672 (-),score=134.81 TRINITY_DN2647_c0_g1_i2:27-2042(-)